MPEVIIQGPAGRIEARYHQQVDHAPVALILHPHPLHGGNMNNKVTYALYKSFAQKGFNTLRFNFRGVGKSEGTFGGGEGELSDAASVLDWLQTRNKGAHQFWIAGFSFGAWITLQLLMRRPELDNFIVVAPPSNKYDFNFLAPCPVSGKIIQGTSDDIVPAEYTRALADKLAKQKGINIDLHEIEGADHFFKENLSCLNDAISNYITGCLEKKSC